MQTDGAMVEPTDFPPEIDSWNTEYDWEWDTIKPQLEKWWADGTIPQDARFYAVTGNNKYGGFSFKEFIGLNMEDLELLAKFGQRVKGIFASGQEDEKLTALRQMLKKEMKNPAPKIGAS